MSGRGIAGVALCAPIATATAPAIAPAGAQGADTYAVAQAVDHAVDIQPAGPYKIARTPARNVPTNVYDALINRDAGVNPVSGLANVTARRRPHGAGTQPSARGNGPRRSAPQHRRPPVFHRPRAGPEDAVRGRSARGHAVHRRGRLRDATEPRADATPELRLKMFAAAPR